MTRKYHRTSAAIVTALALGAVAAPAAQARFDQNPVYVPTPATQTQPVAVRVIHVADRTGFAWDDAAIGAGGAIGLATICVGGTLAAGGRRHRHANPRHASPA